MHIKYCISVLLILLISILVSACEPPPPPILKLTPRNTSAETLLMTIGINENQNARDGMSTLTLQFRTDVVKESNYVVFSNKESITCNGTTLQLGDAPTYVLPVKQGGYVCTYTQGGSSVNMIDVAARSSLAPQQIRFSSQGYTIHYTPDTRKPACTIKADATDGVTTVSGSAHPSSSDQGQYRYQGSDINSLTGSGAILLTRTCSWTLRNSFDAVNLTYESTASVPVTWSH